MKSIWLCTVVHGYLTVLDHRHMNYDKSALAPEDDEHTRAWARDFYLANEAYLRSSTHTREGLAFFFKTWYSSSAATLQSDSCCAAHLRSTIENK